MNRCLWIPLAALGCLTAGCGQKSWVGQWEGKKIVNKVPLAINLNLTPNGTFELKQLAIVKDVKFEGGMTGYYTVEDDKFTFTVTTRTMDKKTVKTAEYQPPIPFIIKKDDMTYGKGSKEEIVLHRVKRAKK